MEKEIPNLSFRIEPGFTFDQKLLGPEFCNNNLLIGGLEKNNDADAFFLGKSAEYQSSKNIWMDCEGAHAIYVVGKRRSGKTFTLGVLLEGLASSSWIKQGEISQGVLFLDSMNVLVTMSHNVEDVYKDGSSQYLDVKKWKLLNENFKVVYFYPKGTAPPPEGESKEITIKPSDLNSDDWCAMFGVDSFSDPIGQLIADIYEKVALEGYVDTNDQKINSNEKFLIEDLIECLHNCSTIKIEYHSDTIRAVLTRFRAIKRIPIFSNSGIELKELLQPGKISILLLRDLDQNLRSLLVGIIVKKTMELRSISDKFERIAQIHFNKFLKSNKNKNEELELFNEYIKKSKNGLVRSWIIIDEAHNYIPSRGITPSREPLKKYVNEGRNLGLSIVVATQNPSALDPSINRNADVIFVHSMSMRDDISVAEAMINTFIPSSIEINHERISSRIFEQLVRSLPIGYAIISNDRLSRISIVKIRPRITCHGGIDY